MPYQAEAEAPKGECGKHCTRYQPTQSGTGGDYLPLLTCTKVEEHKPTMARRL